MSRAHLLLSINVVISRVLVLGKVHAAAGPVGSESARLDAGELDAPFRLDFMADGLGEALDRPLGGTVDAEGRDTALAANGSDLLDHAARWRVLLAHNLHCLASAVNEAEEVDFHLGRAV